MKKNSLIIVITFFAIFEIIAQKSELVFINSNQNLGNSRTFGIAIEDVDLDEDEDIFITNYIASSRLWINDGEGNFSESEQTFSSNTDGSHGVAIANLNGDSYPDIFLINNNASSKVFFNDGLGNYTDSGQNIGSGTDSQGMVSLADVDSDGDIDAFICYYGLPNRLWLNDGNGFFTITDAEYGGDNSTEHLLVDLNNDEFSDLFLCIMNQEDEVWFNDGQGNFTNSGQTLGIAVGFDHPSSQDIDMDGDIDIVVANSEGGITVLMNQDSTGTFIPSDESFEVGARRPCLFDADLDGDFDLFTSHFTNGNKLWINDGSGNFASMGTIFGYSDVISVGFGKIDSDDDYDIVLGVLENNGGNKLFYNESVVGIYESHYNKGFELCNNYPNPFSNQLNSNFYIPTKGYVKVDIYNIHGEIISELLNDELDEGNHSLNWSGTTENGRSLEPGIYFVCFNYKNHIQSFKIIKN